MRFPFAALGGKRVPDFGLKLGCVFQRLLYRKLCPGIEPQGGTCFPVEALERKVLSNPAAQNAAPAFLAVVVGKGSIAYTRDDGVAVISMAALGA